TLAEFDPQYLIIERCLIPNCSGLSELVLVMDVFSAFTTVFGSSDSLISTPNPRNCKLQSSQIRPSTRDKEVIKRMQPVSSLIAFSSSASRYLCSKCNRAGIICIFLSEYS